MLLGITGSSGSGKTFVAQYIQDKLGLQEIYSIATPVKQIAEIIGFPRDLLHNANKDEIYDVLGISPREFMQKFGTDIGRELIPKLIPDLKIKPHKSIWIAILNNKISAKLNNSSPWDMSKLILIDDVRFKDEFDYVHDQNGMILKVVRDNNNRLDSSSKAHKSEVEMKSLVPDFVIRNDGTKDELVSKIDAFMKCL